MKRRDINKFVPGHIHNKQKSQDDSDDHENKDGDDENS